VHRLVTLQEQILMLLGAMIYKVNETFLGVTLPGRSPSACQNLYATRLTIAIAKSFCEPALFFLAAIVNPEAKVTINRLAADQNYGRRVYLNNLWKFILITHVRVDRYANQKNETI
jgi:hypothetical protein